MVEEMDGAFLTSTPYGVMPIRKIEKKEFNLKENGLSLKIMNLFRRENK